MNCEKRNRRYSKIAMLIIILIGVFASVRMAIPANADSDDYILVIKPVELESPTIVIPDCTLTLTNTDNTAQFEDFDPEDSGTYEDMFIIDTSKIAWFTPGINVDAELSCDDQTRINNTINMYLRKIPGHSDYDSIAICLAAQDSTTTYPIYQMGKIWINNEFYKTSPDLSEMFEPKDQGSLRFHDYSYLDMKVQYGLYIQTAELDDIQTEPFYQDLNYTLTITYKFTLYRFYTGFYYKHDSSGQIIRYADCRNQLTPNVYIDPELSIRIYSADVNTDVKLKLRMEWNVNVTSTGVDSSYSQSNSGLEDNFWLMADD